MPGPISLDSRFARLIVYSYLDSAQLLNDITLVSKSEHQLILGQKAALLGRHRRLTIKIPNNEPLIGWPSLQANERRLSIERALYLANHIDMELPEGFCERYLVRLLKICVKETLNVTITLLVRNEYFHDV
jgi:hypothetical protein